MNKTFAARGSSASRSELNSMRSDPRGDEVIDIGVLAGTLWRGKLLILLVALGSALIGGYYAYFEATPLYRSVAVVMLNSREEQVLNLDSVIGGLTADASVVNSEVEVLRSRSLLGKVVDSLDLAEDPEFNGLLKPPTAVDAAKQTIKEVLGLMKPVEVRTDQARALRHREATIDGLLAALSVRNVPLSLVFQVTVQTTSPLKSARLADAIVDRYILYQLDVKIEATRQATSWLTGRLAELQVQLEQDEARVKEFRAATDLINRESLEALERQMKELRDRIETTRATWQSVTQRLAAIRAAATRQAQAKATDDAQLTRLLPRIEEAAISQAFDTRFAQLSERAALEVNRAASQLQALTASQAELEKQIEAQSNDLITLQQLTREAEASRLLYEYFLARLKETSAQQGIQQADSRVLSGAVVPVLPSAPRKSLILAISGLLGLILGATAVLIREARSDSFRTARSLENTTGYPVLGQVPLLPARQRRDAIAYLSDKPTSVAAEAVRNLRTSVLLSNVDTPPQVIVTSSAVPGEGKTTLSLALAQNLSGLDKKVLLIEGDIRRRVMARFLETDQKKGLIAVLAGEQRLADTVIRDRKIAADVLLGEKSQANAADLFASESLNQNS